MRMVLLCPKLCLKLYLQLRPLLLDLHVQTEAFHLADIMTLCFQQLIQVNHRTIRKL